MTVGHENTGYLLSGQPEGVGISTETTGTLQIVYEGFDLDVIWPSLMFSPIQ